MVFYLKEEAERCIAVIEDNTGYHPKLIIKDTEEA
jgi:hypothetical protein